MPIVKRSVEPTHISRCAVDAGMRNELECMANSTMANIIRQLSSLSAHAEDLFTELHRETCFVFQRSAQLDERVERLKIKITQLNPTVEEVSLQDINMRKPFRSSVIKDQQIATFETRPLAIVARYQLCDAPPPLHKLNAYREDGKDSMKFYTDPGYFFELWCMEMAKDSEAQAKKHRHRNRQKRQSSGQPKTIRVPKNHLDELSDLRHGPELAETLRRQHSRPSQQQQQQEINRRPSSSIEFAGKPAAGRMTSAPQHNRQSEYGFIVPNGTAAARTAATREASAPNPVPLYNSGNAAKRQDSTISDSGYSSPKMVSDYQLPNSRMSESSSMGPSTPGTRPMGPPPAPPTSIANVASPIASSKGFAPSQQQQLSGGSVAAHRTPSAAGTVTPGRTMSSAGRESLPPPPPTPQVALPQPTTATEFQSGLSRIIQENRSRDSFGLPPPPTPPNNLDSSLLPSPPSNLRDFSAGSMPPIVPPPPPSSLPPFDFSVSSPLPLPPENMDFPIPIVPPPPPPLVESDSMSTLVVPGMGPGNGSIAGSDSQDRSQPDTVSECSETSSIAASMSKVNADGKPENMVRDTRSDLLSAIREGFQLRKVEERRQLTEKKQQQTTTGRLDVQTIMEAAFERRRRALEENDSDHDGEDEGDGWDDE